MGVLRRVHARRVSRIQACAEWCARSAVRDHQRARRALLVLPHAHQRRPHRAVGRPLAWRGVRRLHSRPVLAMGDVRLRMSHRHHRRRTRTSYWRDRMTANLENLLSVAMLAPLDNPASAVCRWGAPIIFWGPPGIGKSGRVEEACAAAGLEVEPLFLSTLQPEDLSGIPMPNTLAEGGVTRVCDLPQIQGLIAAKKGILFLDELTTARPAVQGAGLGVVYNRRVAGKRLPGGVRVIAAANPPEEAAGGWNLAPPMANRFL